MSLGEIWEAPHMFEILSSRWGLTFNVANAGLLARLHGGHNTPPLKLRLLELLVTQTTEFSLLENLGGSQLPWNCQPSLPEPLLDDTILLTNKLVPLRRTPLRMVKATLHRVGTFVRLISWPAMAHSILGGCVAQTDYVLQLVCVYFVASFAIPECWTLLGIYLLLHLCKLC